MLRGPLGLAILLLLFACGGGGGGTDVPAPSAEIRLGTGDVTLVLDREGRLVDVRLAGDARGFAAADPQPLLEMVLGGETLTPEGARAVAGGVRFSFDGGAAAVRLEVEEASGCLRFGVAEVRPSTVETLRLRLALSRLDEVDPALNGTYDEDAILCLRSIDATTRCVYRSLPGGVPQPGVEWDDAHGIAGGTAALIATPRPAFHPAVAALQAAEGLPSPRFDGRPARESPTARRSYLFLTFLRSGDVASIVEYAAVAGLSRVLLLRDLWRSSSGTYGLDPVRWPGGLPEFQGFCDQLRAGGLGVGLHFYGPSISTNDPLVTPVPEDGLLAWPCPPLATGVDASAATLTLAAAPSLPPSSGGGFPGRYVCLEDELVQYAGAEAGPPFRFTGCKRGALGTTASAHAAGVVPRHLATVNDLFLIDPDGPLVETVSANLASVVNASRADMVYYDGAAIIPTNAFVQRWYYMNRILPAMYAAFDHDVLVQTALGAGRDLDWHLVPSSASADGHGDIKWYLDRRTPAIESIRRSLTIPDIGWYGFDAGRPPDHLEYVCAKALGWDCGISLQTNVLELDADPRAREVMEMIGRYERWKRAGGPPTAVRDELLEPGRDFRLLEAPDGTPRLFQATYDPARDLRALSGGAYAWTVGNSDGTPRVLGVEITRGEAIRAHADFAAPGVRTIDAMTDASPYAPGGANDSARLVNRVSKTMNAAGPARSGVAHTCRVVADAAVGGQALEISADNGNTTIGWCAVGRVFQPALDLSGQAATGIWIHGDGSGIELSIEMYDDADDRAVVKVPLFFDGWRYHTFPLTTPAAFDPSKVTCLVVVVADLPPESVAAVRFASYRTTPTVIPQSVLEGVSLEVGGRSIALPGALPSGATARIDALGRLTIWTGGMEPGTTTTLPGGPLEIAPGVTPITFRSTGPMPYPGDVVVRTSRLVLRHP